MMKTVLDTLSKFDSDDIARLTKTLGDTDLSRKAKQAVSILPVTGLSADVLRDAARTTGRMGRRYGRTATRYVAANPTRSGIGAGTVLVAGLGAFVLYRMSNAKVEPDTETKLLPEPESVDA